MLSSHEVRLARRRIQFARRADTMARLIRPLVVLVASNANSSCSNELATIIRLGYIGQVKHDDDDDDVQRRPAIADGIEILNQSRLCGQPGGQTDSQTAGKPSGQRRRMAADFEQIKFRSRILIQRQKRTARRRKVHLFESAEREKD